jgi:transposase
MEVLYPRCAGLDVHKDTVVAAVRLAIDGPACSEVRTFDTTTPGLLALLDWLSEAGCTHVAMEATGVYWKPVWHILSDGDITLILANAAHVKNVPGRKTDVADSIWIAQLLVHGLASPSFVPPRSIRLLPGADPPRPAAHRGTHPHDPALEEGAPGRCAPSDQGTN